MSNIHIHCPHFADCSGCSFNESIDQLNLVEEARSFFKEKKIPSLKLEVGNPIGWRCRAKLAVRGKSADPRIGLFEHHSHRVVDIPQCRVHHPSINQAVEALRQWIIEQRIEPYDEVSGTGLIRYVQLAAERATGHVQIVLVLNENNSDFNKGPFISLWEKHSNLWHSLWINFNQRRDNIIFGSDWHHLEGKFWLWESLLGQTICFHPASFVQANLDMFERLLNKVQQLLPIDAEVVEFYAGVGAIGLAIAKQCQKIVCIEMNPLAEVCFNETCRHLPPDLIRRLSFFVGKSTKYTHLLNQIRSETGVMIVDPPRKGLESDLLYAIITNKILKKLIYISCGWKGFQRDCNHLLEAGWFLTSAEAFLFFPGSDQIEILTVFERK